MKTAMMIPKRIQMMNERELRRSCSSIAGAS
jgi:hypothetical protein